MDVDLDDGFLHDVSWRLVLATFKTEPYDRFPKDGAAGTINTVVPSYHVGIPWVSQSF